MLIDAQVHMESGSQRSPLVPDTCTLSRFGEVPTTVSPFSLGEVEDGVVVLLGGPKLSVNCSTVRNCL